MLYRTLLRMIGRGQTDGMDEKLDIFFATDKLTKDEYDELMSEKNDELDEIINTLLGVNSNG